ncbi:MAG: hypothetical protein R2851_23415 [Caldilineaceae bacterium]
MASRPNNALGVGDISYEDYMAQRSPDPGLTQIGKRQAEMVARHLAADGPPGEPERYAVGLDTRRLRHPDAVRQRDVACPADGSAHRRRARVGPAGHGRHP